MKTQFYVFRVVACLAASLSLLGFGGARAGEAKSNGAKYLLKAVRQSGQNTRVEASLEVGGKLKLKGKKGADELPMTVAAKLAYDERLIEIPTATKTSGRAVRRYSDIDTKIRIGQTDHQPKLRDDRRLIVVDRADDTTTIFSPQGALTRDELDLIDVVGNSLVIDDLLPGENVATGQEWTPADGPIGGLLGLDAVTKSEIRCRLEAVEGDVARIGMHGPVQGSIEGVATNIDIKAKFHFHLRYGRVTGIVMAVKELRSIGVVGPGVDVVAKLKMRLAPVAETPELDAVLAENPRIEQTDELTRLTHTSPDGTYRFHSDRRWYLTSDERNLIVLRMMDRGDLLAQCNLSPLLRRSADVPISLDEYQQDVKQSLGKRAEQIVSAAEWTTKSKQLVYRVVVRGEVETVPVEWHYYLVAGQSGRRATLAFTIEGSLVERLATADKDLVGSIEFLEPDVAADEKNAPAEKQAARPAAEAAETK